jgi:putative ABC transport system permease protein
MRFFDSDSWREIFETLAGNKLRTILTAFGVFWGIFLLMVMLGSGDGLENGVEAQFAGQATNTFYVWARRTGEPYRGLPAGRRFDLDLADAAAVRSSVPEAAVVAPRAQLGGYRGGNNVTRGTRAGAFSVMGDLPEIAEIQAVGVKRGRFINQLDLEDRRKVAVIGPRVVELLFEEGEDPIGEHVEIQGVYFTVVGTFVSRRSGDDADRDAQTIFIPFTTFQKAFNYGGEVDWLAITSQPEVPASVTEEKVLQLLKARHRVAPDDRRAFGHFNLEEAYQRVQGLFLGISVLIWIVGSGTLLAGVIGVSNIMLIIIKERTREIGIRRAVGATPAAVRGQVVLEALLLTTVAGYLGLVAGVAVIEALASMLAAQGGATAFQSPSVDLAGALRALLILIVAGTFAGLLPAQRAVSIRPVEALRAE